MSDNTNNEEKEEEIRKDISNFLQINFPQIIAHGGEYSISFVDVDTNFARIQLSGACSGCGISPMTEQQIRFKLPEEVDGIDKIEVDVGFDNNSNSAITTQPSQDSDELKENAPF